MLDMYMYVMGIFFISYTYQFNRKLLRIQWNSLRTWIAFISFICVFKYYLYQIPFLNQLVDIGSLSYIPWYYMVLAGFEEAMFTLPMYYAMQKLPDSNQI